MASDDASLIGRLAPGAVTLRHYQRDWLRGDLLAGVTVAAYLVPQVMAYAEIAGLPAVVGLWAAIGPLAVYAALGSSRQLSVGPESTTALMTAAAIAVIGAGDPDRYAALAAALALVVGAICLLGWVGRLGFVADLLSRPVLVGYLAGIAVLMVVSQLEKVTGVPVEGESTLEEVGYLLTHLSEVHAPTLAVSLSVLLGLLVARRFAPRWPSPLLAMLLAAAVVAGFDLADQGVAVVGAIPAGLPAPRLPDVTGTDVLAMALPALGVAVVAYSDNVLTGRAFAFRRHEQVDANQEFLALGAANLAAGVLQGFPISSSGSRTVIGDSLGSRTQLYSLVTLASVVLTVLLAGPVLEAFPLAALGGIVVYAAIRLVDVTEIRRLAAFRRSEVLLAAATTVAVVAIGVLEGIAVAIGLSILDLLRRVARPHDGILGYVPGVPGMHDVDDYPDAHLVPGLVVYRYDSPLFFANADDFRRRAMDAVDAADTPVEWFLLNAEANTEVDLTGVDALEEVRRTLAERGIVFAMARVKQDLRDSLAAAGFLDKVGEERVFMTLPTAVDAYVGAYVGRHGHAPPGVQIPKPPPTV
ncbi:MAG TPA: SulP family inorganic anion transporter [Nocardioidaceae bacterium]|nr:SulP family inorganic anion transporter [Nocardioidaceae bacterium]